MSVVIRTATADAPQLPRVIGGRAAAPDEWEAWAEEPGHDLVAQDGGRVVGGIHVSLVGRAEAWVENLRVHPETWGRGIAAQLVAEAEAVARRYGASVIRTALPAHEYAAQTVAERAGYRAALRTLVVQVPLPSDSVDIPFESPASLLPPERSAELVRFLESAAVPSWRRLIPLGWRFRRVVPELVRGLLKDRRVIAAMQPDAGAPGVQAAAVFALRGETAILSVLDGHPSGVQAAFGGVIEEAKVHGATRAVAFVPEMQTLTPLAIRDWAPHPWCPDGLLVVEKSLAS